MNAIFIGIARRILTGCTMAKIKVVLKWNANTYVPSELAKIPIKEVRKEYSRLRSIERKRMYRMLGTEFEKSAEFAKNYMAYDPVKELNDVAILYQLAKLAREVESPYNTLKAQKELREQKLSTLHEHGYDFVNEGNFFEFGQFMNDYRARKLDQIYDSDSAAEVFRDAEKLNVDISKIKEDFDFWLENKKAMEEIAKKARNKKGFVKYEYYKQRVKQWTGNKKTKRKRH